MLLRLTRYGAAVALIVILAPALLLSPGLAGADTSSSLTVIGTSDIGDSGLMSNVIQPQFHAAFPQYSFNYIGSATGPAITSAENGSQGASVLIADAASLENQFVAGGFSQEPFGRATFTDDFVLGGPANGDPAGITAPGPANGRKNIVQAFADIAAAGINGGAKAGVSFVSRGGTAGTTVEEHQIWALVGGLPNPPSGLHLCTLSSTNGGGQTPVAAGVLTNSGDPCPNQGGVPSGADLPKWYVATGRGQGPTVTTANLCSGFQSPADTCYVLTDRGTFDYLASGSDPAGPIPNLTIVTRGPQSTSAPGGPNLLTNYFHAYIVDPSKPGETVNLTAAKQFMDFLTSLALQSQLTTYLDDTSDSAGAPFVADASPILTLRAPAFPSSNNGGSSVTVSGQLTNTELGYPALANQPVTVDELAGGVPTPVKTATTDSAGNFTITFVPPSSGSYQVSTSQIQMIENNELNPPFGDLLSPAATDPGAITVNGAVSISTSKGGPGGATATGLVAPSAPDANASVAILARQQGSDGSFTEVGGTSLAAGESAYAVDASLPPGKWQLETSYVDPGQFVAATSAPVTVTIPGSGTTVRFNRVRINHGALIVNGTLGGVSGTGGTVRLFALRTVPVLRAARAHTKVIRVRANVSFPRVGRTRIAPGKSKFTIRAKLKRGFRYVLQLQYAPKGAPGAFSRLKTVDVH